MQLNVQLFNCQVAPQHVVKFIGNIIYDRSTVHLGKIYRGRNNVRTSVNFRAYCPNDRPQQCLCGHCVQTYPIAIAVCIVVPQIACCGTEIVVYIRTTTC